MKKIILASILSLMALNTFALDFSTEKQESVTVTIGTTSCGNGICEGFDTSSSRKLRIVLSEGNMYSLLNSSRITISTTQLSNEDFSQLRRMLNNVRKDCPLTYVIDRQTVKIKSVHLGCDILATSQAEENAG